MANYELIGIGGKTYPAAITNYSLSMGEKLGLLSGSNLTDVLKAESHFKVIFLALIGVKNDFKMTFEEFVALINGKVLGKDLEEIYNRLLLAATEMKNNKFANAFKKSTSNKIEKNQKKIKPPNPEFECVEDRYVWYCMIYGIDSEIFWYHPIPDVERILVSKQAYNDWKSNPK